MPVPNISVTVGNTQPITAQVGKNKNFNVSVEGRISPLKFIAHTFIVAAGPQEDFTLPDERLDNGFFSAFVNGVYQNPNQYTLTGTDFHFEGLDEGDTLDVIFCKKL